MKITLATRRSALALAQSRQVAAALVAANPGLTVEELHVVTEGDRVTDRPLAAIGGKGLFVKEIEEALLDGRADLAVHSMKDLPADLAPGLTLAAVPERASPYDLFIARDGGDLDALPEGAHLGTSSRRRELQLKALRPDLRVSPLRGNVDTRLWRLREGDYDAIVLAAAGLARLGVTVDGASLEGRVVPAVAQGALALEARDGDDAVIAAVGRLHHRRTSVETAAERGLMRALGGSCTLPLGALARWDEARDTLAIEGYLASEDGAVSARDRLEGEVRDEVGAAALGAALGERLRVRRDARGRGA